MLKVALTITVSLFATTQAATDGSILQVLSPPEHISVSNSRIHIVGTSSAAEVEVRLNGLAIGNAPVIDSVFHFHLNYGFGLNEVELIPRFPDSTPQLNQTRTIEILYGPEVSRRYRRMYPTFTFHKEAPREECLVCHGADAGNPEGLANEAACMGCHMDMRDKFEKHTKADDRTCVNCHQLEGYTTIEATEPSNDNPCYNCHTDKIGPFSQEYIHGPVAGGGCTVCHNPHGTAFDKNLHSPVQELCFSCHEDLADELKNEYLHHPFRDGFCTECHDPHSTNNRWMLIKNSENVCLACHEKEGTLKTHRHPYNVKPKNKLLVDLQLNEKGRLECISCHNPHSAKVEHLLKVSGEYSCVGCHVDYQ